MPQSIGYVGKMVGVIEEIVPKVTSGGRNLWENVFRWILKMVGRNFHESAILKTFVFEKVVEKCPKKLGM